MLPAGGMCYLSEWPKSFLKAVIRHYSRYQVRAGADTAVVTLDTEPQHRCHGAYRGHICADACAPTWGEARPATSRCAEYCGHAWVVCTGVMCWGQRASLACGFPPLPTTPALS